MNKPTLHRSTPRQQGTKAGQAAIQAALLLRQAGFKAEAAAIWSIAKAIIAS